MRFPKVRIHQKTIKNSANGPMAHRFLIKDIALQAGLGTATVDRVVNNRGGVRRQTVRRVEHAIRELEQQEFSIIGPGRKFIIDFVIEAPDSFGRALRNAIAMELPLMKPVMFRSRTDIRLLFAETEIGQTLDRIRKRGSHAVILMAPDTEEINAQVERLAGSGIPVIAVATDLPASPRIGYVGLNNLQAGETAAYLMRQWLPGKAPHVLVTVRNNRFRGEEEREIGFRAHMRKLFERPRFTELVEGASSSDPVGPQVFEALGRAPDIEAIYSIGGSNRQILKAFDARGRSPRVFIAHDFDSENREFLQSGRINVVLDHDLRQDVRNACHMIMAHHKVIAANEVPAQSPLRALFPPMLSG
jgi:LacI family transcriptional regulator